MADGERAERLGEIIRRQRELQELSMRQLADLVGISNPYLSQIERGLREPSEKVLESIAQNLELSGRRRVRLRELAREIGLRGGRGHDPVDLGGAGRLLVGLGEAQDSLLI